MKRDSLDLGKMKIPVLFRISIFNPVAHSE